MTEERKRAIVTRNDKVELLISGNLFIIGVPTKVNNQLVFKEPRQLIPQPVPDKPDMVQFIFQDMIGQLEQIEIHLSNFYKGVPDKQMIDKYFEVVTGIALVNRPLIDQTGQPLQ